MLIRLVVEEHENFQEGCRLQVADASDEEQIEYLGMVRENQIPSMKTAKQITFLLKRKVPLTRQVADATLLTLQYFVRSNDCPPLHRVDLLFSSGILEQEYRVLSTALGWRTFQQFVLCRVPRNSPEQESTFMIPLCHDRRLEGLKGLELSGVQLGLQATNALAESMVGDGPKAVEFLDCNLRSGNGSSSSSSSSSMDRTLEENLARGLSRNRNLQRFRWISFREPQVDEKLAVILQGFVGHVALKELILDTSLVGNRCMEVLLAIFSQATCSIRHLQVNFKMIGQPSAEPTRFDVASLLQGIPVTHSLERLEFAQQRLNAVSANTILRHLWKCPRVTSLSLSLNQIEDWKTLARDLLSIEQLPAQSRLRFLDLTPYPTSPVRLTPKQVLEAGLSLEEHVTVPIMNLLTAFPELGDFGQRWFCFTDPEFPICIQDRMARNRCIGTLLLGNPTAIPWSVWPLVLEKAQRDYWLRMSPQCCADILYQIIQGPAFAARTGLSYVYE